MDQDQQRNFNNPPANFRIIPFWFWNGALDEAEIEYQIREMAEKGLGGFFIFARKGLKIPYLSDLWFSRVKFALERACHYCLEAWLYGEYLAWVNSSSPWTRKIEVCKKRLADR
jgi:hypothetical protein